MARWHSCNILQIASDANRLWQFEARGGGFALNREQRGALDEPLPSRFIAKSWSSLWQPRLNVAWLPPENVFLRVIELPRSNFEETFAMVELQLEKLSPMPVTQIVWTIHVLSRRGNPPREAKPARRPRLPAKRSRRICRPWSWSSSSAASWRNFSASSKAGVISPTGWKCRCSTSWRPRPRRKTARCARVRAADAWIYPVALAGQSAALVAWWCGNALRSLSFVVLPPAGDRAKNLKAQLAQLAWAGELEGWLTAPLIQWHLVADPAVASGMGKRLARRFERAGASRAAAAAGGTGRAHGATRGGGGFTRGVAARGISRALPSAIC